MPGGNGTGPAGMGPMTGRAAGFCAGYNMPGYGNPYLGRGFGRGAGRGWQNRFYASQPGWMQTEQMYPQYIPVQQVTPEQQIDALKQQADFLQDQLGQINTQLQQLQQKNKK